MKILASKLEGLKNIVGTYDRVFDNVTKESISYGQLHDGDFELVYDLGDSDSVKSDNYTQSKGTKNK